MLNSKRRIAVVVLGGLCGWCLQRFAAVPQAMALGLLVGLFAAPFVPAKGSCGTQSAP